MSKIVPSPFHISCAGFGYQSELEARVAEAARRQYNKLKMQTKAEIRQTIDRLLVGDFIVSFCPQIFYVGFSWCMFLHLKLVRMGVFCC